MGVIMLRQSVIANSCNWLQLTEFGMIVWNNRKIYIVFHKKQTNIIARRFTSNNKKKIQKTKKIEIKKHPIFTG